MNRQLFAKAFALFETIQSEASDADVVAAIYEALVEAKDGVQGTCATIDAPPINTDRPATKTDAEHYHDMVKRTPAQSWTPQGGWQDIPGYGRVMSRGVGGLTNFESGLRSAEQDFSFR